MPEIENIGTGPFQGAREAVYKKLVESGAVDAYVKSKSWGWWLAKFAGKNAWIIGTTVLVLGLPYALAAERESAFIQMEQAQIQQLRAQGFSMDHIHQLQQTGQLLQMAQQQGAPAGAPQGQPAPGGGAPAGMTPL